MITAFIPTYNSERTLKKTIQSIKSQSIHVERIIVIDSGSIDNTKQIAKEENIEFYSPKYFGFDFLGLGRARNRILDLINTPYILSVDSDVVLERDYIKKLFPLIEKNENIAGIAAKQIEFNRIYVPDRTRAVIEMRDLNTPLSKQKKEFKDFLLGSNNIYRVDCLKSISSHPYDDNLTTNYEDVDIGIKLTKRGYKLLWTPKVLTFHLQKDDLYSFVNRAYRYRVFKWLLKGAFTNLEIYKHKVEHNINYTKMGFEISVKKRRFYLLYPYFLIGFYFFLQDAFKFYKHNLKKEGDTIISCFQSSLNLLKNNNLKKFIIKDLQKLSCYKKLISKVDKFELDEVKDWFFNLSNFHIIKAILKTDDSELIEKLLLISRDRIDFEKNLNVEGNNKILILDMNHINSINYTDSLINSFSPNQKVIDFFFDLQSKKKNSWILNAAYENYNEDEIFYEILGYKPKKIFIYGNIAPNLEERIKWITTEIFYF